MGGASVAGSSLLLSSVTAYFQKTGAAATAQRALLHDVITGISPISLRLLDGFVTHYSRTQNVIYWVDDARGTIHETVTPATAARLRKFHLYFEYRAQLKSYTKMYFDPFRRHDRITFVLDPNASPGTPGASLETTVGQLNFFRWCFQSRILEYVQAHLTDIEKELSKIKRGGAATTATAATATPVPAAETPAKRRGSGGIHKNPTVMSQCRSVMRTPCHVRFD